MKRRLMLLMAMVVIAGAALAQDLDSNDNELSGRELRKEKRRARKALIESEKEVGRTLIENRDFVLQAERIGDKWGTQRFVSNQINFIRIEGEDIVIQLGSLSDGQGRNGLGGITYRGKIKSMTTKDRGKGKAFTAHIRFHTPLLLDVTTIDLSIRGDEAHAVMWNNGVVRNFDGFYYSKEESTIHESDILDVF